MSHAIKVVASVILMLVRLVMEFIAYIDRLLVGLMNAGHIPENVQTILLVVVALALVFLAIRILGGVFATLIIILLLLLVVHKVDPGLAMPHGATGHLPASSSSTKP